jgi:flagellar biosynthetic protein FlhB
VQKLASAVPKADVVITNPTHFAVALRYDRGKMNAPEVVAKGTGYLALRIRELAREAGVPIVERKPLARALYASVKVGQQIPAELYRAVAEVLGYVYRVKGTSPRE